MTFREKFFTHLYIVSQIKPWNKVSHSFVFFLFCYDDTFSVLQISLCSIYLWRYFGTCYYIVIYRTAHYPTISIKNLFMSKSVFSGFVIFVFVSILVHNFHNCQSLFKLIINLFIFFQIDDQFSYKLHLTIIYDGKNYFLINIY